MGNNAQVNVIACPYDLVPGEQQKENIAYESNWETTGWNGR